MEQYDGSCLCGAVTLTVAGVFEGFYLCHCRHCQKDTGSAHAANLFVRSGTLTWRSGASLVRSFTLPRTRHVKSFCQCCGSALPTVQPDGVLVVPAGCLDRPLTRCPTAHLFMARRAAWDQQPTTLAAFDTLPG